MIEEENIELCQPVLGQSHGLTRSLILSRIHGPSPAKTSGRTRIIRRPRTRMKRSAIPGPKARINPHVRKIRLRGGIKRTVRIIRTVGIDERAGIETGVKTGQGHTGNECRISEPCARIIS